MGAAQIRAISAALISMNGWVPCEFTRRSLRSLLLLKRFKATEYRLILLYVGLIIFSNLPRPLYQHFLVFHVIATIFVDPSLCASHLNYAGELSVYFVKSFIDLYGREFVSHCVHSMIYVKADVEKFGAVDNFSAFRFENFYRTLTRLVRKGDKPLQQSAKRYLELEKKLFQAS